ncbi:hypothetical protein ACTFIY_010136 [Dictyostelium cf. discoideum]
MFKKLLFFTLTFALFALAICDNSIKITQTLSSAWEGHSTWNVVIENIGDKPIFGATIVAESGLSLERPDNLWSLDSLGNNRFGLPSWITQNGGLKSFNGTHTFGYTNAQPTSAVFSVTDIRY